MGSVADHREVGTTAFVCVWFVGPLVCSFARSYICLLVGSFDRAFVRSVFAVLFVCDDWFGCGCGGGLLDKVVSHLEHCMSCFVIRLSVKPTFVGAGGRFAFPSGLGQLVDVTAVFSRE